jgi:hypothetical protein
MPGVWCLFTWEVTLDRYVESPRAIILAVVQAGNDIANQAIIRKAKAADPEGVRTVGIITKPDLINDGAEQYIARLANNQGTVKLKLGFFVLKNPTPKDIESGLGAVELARLESDFFELPAWKQHDIDVDRVSASKLKYFLQSLLHEHIEREIPHVKKELQNKLLDAELKLRKLGNPRHTVKDARFFLIERNMALHKLTQDALQGNYLGSEAPFFLGNTRLQAFVHKENIAFADTMRTRGAKRVVRPLSR